MPTQAEQLVDLLTPGVAHMARAYEGVDYRLIATHGRVDISLRSPTRPDGFRSEIISAREIERDDWRMAFKPRVEAALQKVLVP